MPSVLKISESASLALHAMVYLAAHRQHPCSNLEIAQALKASANHLSKVLQRLHRAGLVESVRGPKGGHFLSREPSSINLLEIYEAIEGPFESSPCLFSTPVCSGGSCILGGLVKEVNLRVRAQLRKTRLSELRDCLGK